MRLTFSALIFLLGCSSSDSEVEREAAYLLAGQSNATGGGDGSGMGPVEGTRYRYRIQGSDGSKLREGSGIPVQPLGETRPRFGPELGFAQETPDATVLKFASNGTGIQRFVPGGDLFDEWMTWIGGEPFQALLWVHGSANATSKGAEYRGHLHALASAFDVPIALVQLHADADRPQVGLVREAQQAFADDTGACLVSIDELPLKEDQVHWETETQLEAGRRLAECF